MSGYISRLADKFLGYSEEVNGNDVWETGWIDTREGHLGEKKLQNRSLKDFNIWASNSDKEILSADTTPLNWSMNVPGVNVCVPGDQPNSNVLLKTRYSRRGDFFQSTYGFDDVDKLAGYVTRFKHSSLSARKGRNEAGLSEILHDGPIDEAKQVYKEAVEEF